MRILLMGNPNVGKSVIFSRLTGVHVMSSNYPGTTVGFTAGYTKVSDKIAEVVDVPGAYTLEPTCEAEEVALKMLQNPDSMLEIKSMRHVRKSVELHKGRHLLHKIFGRKKSKEDKDEQLKLEKELQKIGREGRKNIIVNVLDATNLERNLYLTMQLLEYGLPMIVVLNMWDDTRHTGIKIDLKRLEALLGVPVVTTSAINGEGIKEMVGRIPQAKVPANDAKTSEERWKAIGEIVGEVQHITHRHHTFRERLADASVKPLSGSLIAAAILAASFMVIRFIGESLITYVFDPLFENFWAPLMLNFSETLGGEGFLHDMLIGTITAGEINFPEALGLLTSGLYVPFAMVLPYIIAFYLILGVLEDTGYLPRLAVLVDNIMHRVGLHGYAIIPNMLGLGCNVPAVLATRALESKRERFIAATLISIAVPCAALQAMIFGLVGAEGGGYVVMVYATLFISWIVLGFIMNKMVKGYSPELLIEVPPYRVPPPSILLKKLAMRIKGFLHEAIPIILGAIAVINLLNIAGVFEKIAKFAEPVVTGILGLPKEAATALVVGFLRKDAAMGLFAPLDMTAEQLVIGSVVLAMLFPCIATFVVLFRELGLKGLLKSMAIMIIAALTAGGLLNVIL